MFHMGATTARAGGTFRPVILADHGHIDNGVDGRDQGAAKGGRKVFEVKRLDFPVQKIHPASSFTQKSWIKSGRFSPCLYPAHHFQRMICPPCKRYYCNMPWRCVKLNFAGKRLKGRVFPGNAQVALWLGQKCEGGNARKARKPGAVTRTPARNIRPQSGGAKGQRRRKTWQMRSGIRRALQQAGTEEKRAETAKVVANA